MSRYRPLLLVLALLVLPFAVGGGLYAWGWRPAGGAHGELLDPPRALPPLADASGQPLPRAEFDGHWSLVVARMRPLALVSRCRSPWNRSSLFSRKVKIRS